jgi:hypothetical protein
VERDEVTLQTPAQKGNTVKGLAIGIWSARLKAKNPGSARTDHDGSLRSHQQREFDTLRSRRWQEGVTILTRVGGRIGTMDP